MYIYVPVCAIEHSQGHSSDSIGIFHNCCKSMLRKRKQKGERGDASEKSKLYMHTSTYGVYYVYMYIVNIVTIILCMEPL